MSDIEHLRDGMVEMEDRWKNDEDNLSGTIIYDSLEDFRNKKVSKRSKGKYPEDPTPADTQTEPQD